MGDCSNIHSLPGFLPARAQLPPVLQHKLLGSSWYLSWPPDWSHRRPGHILGCGAASLEAVARAATAANDAAGPHLQPLQQVGSVSTYRWAIPLLIAGHGP